MASPSAPHWRRVPSWLIVSFALLLVFLSRRQNPERQTPAPLIRQHVRQILRRSDAVDNWPPQAPLVFNHTSADLVDIVKRYGAREQAVIDEIIKSVQPEEATFENTLLPYILHDQEFQTELSVVYMYRLFSTNLDLQQTSRDLLSQTAPISETTRHNMDYFARLDRAYNTYANDPSLSAETQKVLEVYWNMFAKAGADAQKVQDIVQELDTISTDFIHAITAEKPEIMWIAVDELDRVPDNFFYNVLEEGTGENKGKMGVPSDYLLAVMADIDNSTLRETIYIARAQSYPDNVARMQRTVELREELAQLKGYPDFATDVLSDTMAKTPAAVQKFLDDLQENIAPIVGKERKILKELKKADIGKDEELYQWDIDYYQKRYQESLNETFSLYDLMDYFSTTTTLQAVLDLYAHLFQLRFVKIEGEDRDKLSPTGKGEDLTWHPDVELYAVWNSGGNAEFAGYLYLDIFSREDKNKGDFYIPIELGYVRKDGSRNYPSAIVATDIEKTDDITLLQVFEIMSLLHELGYATHNLVSQVTYSLFHGTNGSPPDFYESLAKMMENWAQEPDVIQSLGRHWSYLSDESKAAWMKYQNTSDAVQPPERIPDNMIQGYRDLLASNAMHTTEEVTQIFLSTYDLQLHHPPPGTSIKDIDVTELANQLRTQILGLPGPEADGHGYRWGHPESRIPNFASGYQSKYYSYIWSKTIGMDLFTTAFKKDPFSAEQGMRFREIVLKPGGSKDYDEILREFLGRDLNDQAYLQDLDFKG